MKLAKGTCPLPQGEALPSRAAWLLAERAQQGLPRQGCDPDNKEDRTHHCRHPDGGPVLGGQEPPWAGSTHKGTGAPTMAQPRHAPAPAAPQGRPWSQGPSAQGRVLAGPGAAHPPSAWCPPGRARAGPSTSSSEARGAARRRSVSPGAGGGRRAEPSALMSIFCIKYFDN